jgi:hypothetical protein
MQFIHIDRGARRTTSGRNQAFLIDDGWDDYSFKTLFDLVVFTPEGQRIELGGIKLFKRGLQSGRVSVPPTFETLDETFCSLGQEPNYYETLSGLPDDLGDQILRSLRDCVIDPDIYASFREEEGFQTSLLRSVSEQAIATTFAAALGGQAPLTPFHFQYTFPVRAAGAEPPCATFAVDPQSKPPSNVHAVIGRNGVGKTRLLNNIANAICQPRHAVSDPELGVVQFVSQDGLDEANGRFANLVTVTFSAFDPFRAPPGDAVTSGDIRYAYIGLKRSEFEVRINSGIARMSDTKSHDDLVAEFEDSLKKCQSGPRFRRWHEAVQTLESDPGIEELVLRSLFVNGTDDNVRTVTNSFRSLSSGHKIVLLTVTRLVELVDEKTLVLFDEPEAHLHPPLLSSFVRVLSTLLKRRNGAAVIATHSPVVLQETPRNCVWVLRRSGDVTEIERPAIETFGENVGILTREIFGLEVTSSGFHQLVAASSNGFFTTYTQVLDSFSGQLGAEARAIARALSRPDG